MEKNNQDGPDCLILMNYATHGLLIVNNCLNIVYEVTLLLGLCQVFWQRQPKKKKGGLEAPRMEANSMQPKYRRKSTRNIAPYASTVEKKNKP